MIATTQNERGKHYKCINLLRQSPVFNFDVFPALGPIDPSIDVASLGDLLVGTYDKTLFSMLIPEIKLLLDSRPHINSAVVFGIEVRSVYPCTYYSTFTNLYRPISVSYRQLYLC